MRLWHASLFRPSASPPFRTFPYTQCARPCLHLLNFSIACERESVAFFWHLRWILNRQTNRKTIRITRTPERSKWEAGKRVFHVTSCRGQDFTLGAWFNHRCLLGGKIRLSVEFCKMLLPSLWPIWGPEKGSPCELAEQSTTPSGEIEIGFKKSFGCVGLVYGVQAAHW